MEEKIHFFLLSPFYFIYFFFVPVKVFSLKFFYEGLGYFSDVVYQTPAEHGVQLDLVILQDVLEGASRAVLGEEATMRRRDAGANEAHQMIVSHIFHLNERRKKKEKKRTKATG